MTVACPPGVVPRRDGCSAGRRPSKSDVAPIRFVLLGLIFLVSGTLPPLFALEPTSASLLRDAWPNVPARRLELMGKGIGIVFSPDLSVPDNCRFYRSLGFACFQEADWSRVLDQVHRYNVLYPEKQLSTLVLETHGTNGNGLKLQQSYDPAADRSYISVGALQEHLAPDGIRFVIISACNSGRLLRPEIYNRLDPNNGDKLFLPATRGIVNASRDFDPQGNTALIITPLSSHIETTLVGTISELSIAARQALLRSARTLMVPPPKEFAVSDMMAQMVTRDSRLELTTNSFVDDLSRQTESVDRSEQLFRRFITYLNAIAAREEAATHLASAHKNAKTKTARKAPARASAPSPRR